MITAGIVAEYDPFHLGHAWHIAETRRALGPESAVVCVMSGNWVQRADCAVADKWARAALALEGGADLVLELPTPWAMSSAESFARGAVSLLAATGVVDALSFGSEDGTLEGLEQAAAALDAPEYPAALKRELDRGLSFPAARQAAAGAACLATPNNNLGVEYLRALRALNSTIKPMTVTRRGAGHDAEGSVEGFASATQIRKLLRSGDRAGAAELVRPGALDALGEVSGLEHVERAVLARLRTMEQADWAVLPDGGAAEGLPARLEKAARQAGSLAEFYELAKTKRYPHARLRRLALGAFLGLRAEERLEMPPYVRVLGLDETGRSLLRRMKETCALPVIVKPAQARDLEGRALGLFQAEARRTDLYGLCFPTPRPCGAEWTHSPVYR